MENLTISDAPPAQGGQQQSPLPPPPAVLGGAARGPPQPSQLPPQMFTTAAQLLDLTDKKLMVALRDGRKLIGVLRSWDQFANLVLQSTTERIFATTSEGSATEAPRGIYADVPHGIFLVRGENVLLLGEIDLDKDDDPPPGFELAELEKVKKLAKEIKNAELVKEKARSRQLAKIGMEGDNMGDLLL